MFSVALLSLAGCWNQGADVPLGSSNTKLLQHTLAGTVAEVLKKSCLNQPVYTTGMSQEEIYKAMASKAVFRCKNAAEHGDVNAQFGLGLAYFSIHKDYRKSAKWFRLAAEQGQARSQLFLGILYRDGEGVPQDLVSSYMWISISSRILDYIPNNDLDEAEKQKYRDNTVTLKKSYAEIIDPLEKQMTASQIAEAKRQAAECIDRKFKWC
jgi:hypothetical protein